MSGDYETYLETIIENQESLIETNQGLQITLIVIAMALVTTLTYLFISRCMK